MRRLTSVLSRCKGKKAAICLSFGRSTSIMKELALSASLTKRLGGFIGQRQSFHSLGALSFVQFQLQLPSLSLFLCVCARAGYHQDIWAR